MPYDTAIVIATMILMSTFVGMVVLIRRRQRQAREDAMRDEASARGWQFESIVHKGSRIHRWRGTTDGMSWVAESISSAKGGNHPERRGHMSRWHGTFSPGINSPMVLMGMPRGKEVPSFSVAQGDGMLATLAQKAAGFAYAKALSIHFGVEASTEVDASTLHHVTQPPVPGYLPMAADVDEASRVLMDGFARAISVYVSDTTSLLGPDDRPWILVRPRALSLARLDKFHDVRDIERFIHTGIGLAGGFKFGHK